MSGMMFWDQVGRQSLHYKFLMTCAFLGSTSALSRESSLAHTRYIEKSGVLRCNRIQYNTMRRYAKLTTKGYNAFLQSQTVTHNLFLSPPTNKIMPSQPPIPWLRASSATPGPS